jgi:RimJ/RimL family protein N-acetyltransferase
MNGRCPPECWYSRRGIVPQGPECSNAVLTGRGIASRALALFLEQVPVRPLHARAASDNAGSLRVLQKAGFEIIGTEQSFAPARNTEIGETLLRLR